MPTPADAREIASDTVAEAIEHLQERGLDPGCAPQLLARSSTAVQQMLAAIEHGRDIGEYRRYLDEIHRRLDADPLVDDAHIEPPKRRLAMRW